MSSSTMSAANIALLLAVSLLGADERRPSLAARAVTLHAKDISVAKALAAFEQQTGIAVVDRRTAKGVGRSLALDLQRSTFWSGLEDIARQADARVALYQDDGKIALTNGPYRAVPLSLQGIFRTAVRNIAVARNFETAGKICTIELETAWEPWFRPFLMEVGPAVASYAGPMKRPVQVSIPGRGRAPIAGRAALTELRFPAPPRAAPRLDSLKGSFKLIGPSKMLTFRFNELLEKLPRPLVARQDGVKVEVTRIVRQRDRWSFEIAIENPPGGPTYESHQQHLWLEGNRIWLQKGDGKSAVWNPPDEQESDRVTNRSATVTYHFPFRHRSAPSQPGTLADWSLLYTTPGPIVETSVDFEFGSLPLP